MGRIRVQERGSGVVVLAFAHPETLNAIDNPAIREILEITARIDADPSARTLILTGDERAFSTGSDLEEALGADMPGHLEHWRLGHRMLDGLEALSIPVIAAINGWALGGGCEIALACDIRIAGESATLGLPEILLGVIPGWGGTQRLPKLVGRGHASELLFTGERVSAHTALSIGLVNRVVPDDQVLETAIALGERMAAVPRHALAAAKSLVAASQVVETQVGERLEIVRNTECVLEPAFAERVGAFMARRDPGGTR